MLGFAGVLLMPGFPWWGLMELGRPGGLFRAGRGSQRAVSYIQFYGKLSVKNPASRGQVNLDDLRVA